MAQEDLKIIGCVTMVIDHLGVLFFPWVELRIIGRIAFPIFCFLIAQAGVVCDPVGASLRPCVLRWYL